MNSRNSSGWAIWQQEPGGDPMEIPRALRRTYRFPDGVRVMVWAYDLVVWVYPDGRQVQSVKMGDEKGA